MDRAGFKPFLPELRRFGDGEGLNQENPGRLREVGAGENAVADQHDEAGEGAGPFLGEAVRRGLDDSERALRVENRLES